MRSHPYRSVRLCFFSSALILVSVDLKPENVLIAIDDVESVIRAELANAPSTGAPTKVPYSSLTSLGPDTHFLSADRCPPLAGSRREPDPTLRDPQYQHEGQGEL